MIPGILLAAGSARRFGAQKLLAPVAGTPMVCRSAVAALASRLDEVVVVTGNDDVDDVLRPFPNLRLVTNPDPSRGLMSSLRLGLAALPPNAVAAMVLHADMPWMRAQIIDHLVHRFAQKGNIVVPVCGERWRHPRIIPRELFEEFAALDDDARGTEVIDRHRADVVEVAFDDPAPFADVDVPEDLEPSENHNSNPPRTRP